MAELSVVSASSLQDVTIDPSPKSLLKKISLPVHGENHNLDRRILRLDYLGGSQSPEAWQRNIQDDDIRSMLMQELQKLQPSPAS